MTWLAVLTRRATMRLIMTMTTKRWKKITMERATWKMSSCSVRCRLIPAVPTCDTAFSPQADGEESEGSEGDVGAALVAVELESDVGGREVAVEAPVEAEHGVDQAGSGSSISHCQGR